jgi:phage/plasmid primase-like uncharacterized protein
MLAIPAWKTEKMRFELCFSGKHMPRSYAVQLIKDDGDKIFLAGGSGAQGLYHRIQKKPWTAEVTICEGWATGYSYSQQTGENVLVAFTANNSIDVLAEAMRSMPAEAFYYLADNDVSGTGQRMAQRAKALGAAIIMSDQTGNDFNDDYKGLM